EQPVRRHRPGAVLYRHQHRSHGRG
ncbi:MAG: hypothetical protein AVDCRST_MAG48-941, partial [uncultured Friedmanniella sp.]